MNTLDNQPEFGLSIEVTGEAKGPTLEPQEHMKRFIDTYLAHGGLFDQVQAAHLAGVSKQRISQLVKAGRLETVKVTLEGPAGPMPIEETISGNALRAWMESPKQKGGGHLHRSKRQELQAA